MNLSTHICNINFRCHCCCHCYMPTAVLAHGRCRDLPEHMLGKQRYCKLVLAVPGPKPACMDAYLDALGQHLAKLSAGVWQCAQLWQVLNDSLPGTFQLH